MLEFVESTAYKKTDSNLRICKDIATALRSPDIVLELGFICFNWTHIRKGFITFNGDP